MTAEALAWGIVSLVVVVAKVFLWVVVGLLVFAAVFWLVFLVSAALRRPGRPGGR